MWTAVPIASVQLLVAPAWKLAGKMLALTTVSKTMSVMSRGEEKALTAQNALKAKADFVPSHKMHESKVKLAH